MKDRFITLLGGMAALYVVIVLFIHPQPPEATKLSLPVSSDSGEYGLLGLVRWIEQGGVPVKALRRRYDTLVRDATLPRTGNLLVLSLPQRMPARERERDLLKEWVERGNHLLILAAGNDRPQWSLTGNDSLETMLNDLGFGFVPTKQSDKSPSARLPEKKKSGQRTPIAFFDQLTSIHRQLSPQGGHPLLRDLRQVEVTAFSGSPPLVDLVPTNKDLRTTFVLLRDAESGAPVFWEIRTEGGLAWISSYADLFGNISLGRQDNGHLIANLITAFVAPGASVILDDMHQGVSDLYDPEAFFTDPRLHHTLWFLVAFWFLYLFGRAGRLAPLQVRPSPPRTVDFVRALGGFFARRVSPTVVGQQLMANFFNEIRARHRLPLNGRPVWDLLDRSPRANSKQVEKLRMVFSDLGKGRTPNLIAMTNIIQDLRSVQP
ncbi:MAG TPA: DUF4350 domain-containing protein [Nitrospira sp.]|nr:DUF4350 domain-containing protein [Nitrospira sp.]